MNHTYACRVACRLRSRALSRFGSCACRETLHVRLAMESGLDSPEPDLTWRLQRWKRRVGGTWLLGSTFPVPQLSNGYKGRKRTRDVWGAAARHDGAGLLGWATRWRRRWRRRRRRCLRLAKAVEKDGGDDHGEALQEADARHCGRGDAPDGEREHDRDRRRVRLQHVVRVLDDGGNE